MSGLTDVTHDQDRGGAAPVGRRERKKQETHRALEEAAWRLFLRKGFDTTTIDDITEAVDVSQRTFFRHFASKEAVLYADLDDQLVELRAELRARPGDERLLTAVRRAVLALADDFTERRDQHLMRAQIAQASPAVEVYQRTVVQTAFEDVITEAVAERLAVGVDDDLRPRLVAGAASAAIGAAYARWLASGGSADLPSLVNEAFDVLERGIG